MKKIFLAINILIPIITFGQTPIITSFSPSIVGPGDTLIINGSFNQVCFVATSFGGAMETISSSSSKITTLVGYGGNAIGTIILHYDDCNSYIVNDGITFDGIPKIYSVTPLSAKKGDTVIIRGKYLSPGLNGPIAPEIFFGDSASSKIIIDSTSFSVVKAIVGNGASGNISVKNALGYTGTYSGFTIIDSTYLDSLRLVDLYNNTGGPNWKNKTNWLTNKPLSSWQGVYLTNGRVSDLHLSDNNLTGPIPLTIIDLTDLVYLNFNANNLTATIPDSIDKLKKLSTLILSNNHLVGSIPPSLGNLNNLEILGLDQNQLTGNIPASLGNLTTLTQLALYDNKLTGDIPFSFKNLNQLNLIYIDNNQLTGDPSFINEPIQEIYPEFTLENNKFTFVGMEKIVSRKLGKTYLTYSPQAKISIRQTSNKISVSAGGTLSNNTYKWYKNGILIATNTGDSTFIPKDWGIYSVAVSNKIVTQLTLYSDSIVPKIITKELCNPVGNTILNSPLTGTIYQWQYSTDGNNFINLNDNGNYTNTNTATLQLNNIPSSLYGYQYRCNVDGINSNIFSLQFLHNWIGLNNSSWENPVNWNCGTIPDANTDVIINSGTVIVGQNATCRTLTIKPAANVIVNSGVTLSVMH